jgi:plasmid stabilization system protein ParE
MKTPKIFWTKQAIEALQVIVKYYESKSRQAAKKMRKDFLQSPKTIVFAKQYQVDEINPKYRRIIVGNYKVLYKEIKEVVYIMDIVSTKQSPEILRNK